MEDESAKNVDTDLAADTNDGVIKLPGIFRLPRELRDIIYGYIIDLDLSRGFWGDYDGLSLSLEDLDGGESRLEMKDIHKALSVVYTCRQLQEEVQHLLFDRCKVDICFKRNSSRPIKDFHPFPFNLLHLCRDLRVTITVRHQRMPGQFRGARNKPIEEPFSIVHDGTSHRKATLVRSAFRSQATPDADRVEDGAQDAQTPRLWSAVVAPSRPPPSTRQVRDYDLQELYPHRLWSDSFPPFENTPCDWRCVQLFRNLSERHRLRRLEVEFVGLGHAREVARFVHWDLRMGPKYRLPLLTRSDYGAHPYIELISGLRKVPRVQFLYEIPYDDDQGTCDYDCLLMENYLRRQVEDTDEARSLVDFAAQGEGDFDDIYPALPQSTATGVEPIRFESVTPLDLRSDELLLFKCPNRRFRLFDDHNILIPPPLRENTYDAPDVLPWIMRGRGYDAGDTDVSEDSDASSSGLGGDDDLGDSEEGSEHPAHSDGWEPPEPEIPEGSGGDALGGLGSEGHVEVLEGHDDQDTAQAPGESGDEESSGILQVFDSPDEEDAPHGSPFSLGLFPVEWFDSPDEEDVQYSSPPSLELFPIEWFDSPDDEVIPHVSPFSLEFFPAEWLDSPDEEDAQHGSPPSLELFPVECFDSPDLPEMYDSDSSSDQESDYEEYIPRYCLEMGRRRAGYSWVFDDLDDPEGGEGPLESAALMEPAKPETESLLAEIGVSPEWLQTSLLPVAL
ncbi:uncharacterized protein J3D65DRAFT_679937 [Phyllosticta citribraziliensis]|uniref:F-box domain-containing protein n=1 Tax=Phyllosticta citribraziliensis TaxID=989973 RepID=A0ABR1LA45_9PEZI